MAINLVAAGISGIAAAEAEIAATEANFSNASNPNYSAESVTLAASAGDQGIGDGVQVVGVQRAQAPFIGGEINYQQAVQNFNQSWAQAATLAQNYLSPSSGADLSANLQTLFNSFATLAASPTDPNARSAVISAATSFAQGAVALSGNLQQTATDQLAQVAPLVAQVNGLSQQVAALNGQITSAQTANGSAAALLDQRDGLVSQLAGLIGAGADAAGDVTVGGIPLVSGTTALTLGVTGARTNLGLQVSLAQGTLPVATAQIGGTLGGVFAGAASIVQTSASVNTFATASAAAINTAEQGGYGLDGSTGTPLFLIPGASGGPIAINPAITVENLAASATAAGVPGDGSNASAIAALANATGLDSCAPGETLGADFAQIAAQFGTTVATATTNQQQATSTLQSLQQLQSSVTGVSLNEQLTNLMQYQNALEAAGRAVQAANDMTSYLLQVTSP